MMSVKICAGDVPMPIHFWEPSFRPRNSTYNFSSSGCIGLTANVAGSIVAKEKIKWVRPVVSMSAGQTLSHGRRRVFLDMVRKVWSNLGCSWTYQPS